MTKPQQIDLPLSRQSPETELLWSAQLAEMDSILAIDPGLTGAMAIYIPQLHDQVAVYDMPVVDGLINVQELRDIIFRWQPSHCFLENVGPMPRDGVRQAWRFSAAFTAARTVVALMDIPTTMVTPAMWKKQMRVKGGDDGKEQCRALAIHWFPKCARHFARKKDQGRAEAALLALYGNHILRDRKPMV